MSQRSPRHAFVLCFLTALFLTGCVKASSEATSSGQPDLGLGIGGCDTIFPDVDLVGRPPQVVHVGDQVTLTARVSPDTSIQIVRVQFVVAVPGTGPEAGGDPTPAERPANQLAVSTVPPPGVADGQEATLTWTPETAGTFPVIYVEYASAHEDCSTPPPDETDPANAGQSESVLATITVI